MPEEYSQLSAIAILFLIFIKEFFAFLKNKNHNKDNDKVLKLIENMKNNDLDGISDNIKELDRKGERIINLLIEIREKISK